MQTLLNLISYIWLENCYLVLWGVCCFIKVKVLKMHHGNVNIILLMVSRLSTVVLNLEEASC